MFSFKAEESEPVSISLIGLIAIIVLILFLHTLNLTADAPDPQYFARGETGLRVDEGYKTLAPRNLVLFGRTKWSETDEYEGWFSGSPLTQYLLYASFSLAAPNILIARLTALTYFIAVALLILWMHRAWMQKMPFLLVAALLAVEPFLFFFSRAALFEVALGLFITAGLLFIRALGQDRTWAPLLIIVGASIASSLLIKASGFLYFLPALIVFTWFTIRKCTPRHTFLVIVLSMTAVMLVLFFTFEVWSSRITSRKLDEIIISFFTNHNARYSPWITGAAWLCIASMMLRKGISLFDDPYFLGVAATVIGFPVLMSFFDYSPPRYYVAIVPAQILIIAYWLGRRKDMKQNILNWPIAIMVILIMSISLFIIIWGSAQLFLGETIRYDSRKELKIFLLTGLLLGTLLYLMLHKIPNFEQWCLRPFQYTIIIMAILTGGYKASLVWFTPSYASHEIRQKLEHNVSASHAIIGDWAPFFALGTDIPAIYSTTGLNEGKVVLGICPSFYLNSGTQGDIAVIDSYYLHAGLELGPPLLLGQYYGRMVTLHKLQYPEGECTELNFTKMLKNNG